MQKPADLSEVPIDGVRNQDAWQFPLVALREARVDARVLVDVGAGPAMLGRVERAICQTRRIKRGPSKALEHVIGRILRSGLRHPPPAA